MKNIIIFGPPGTGKGTMSKKISEEFGLRHISTGDIIRKNQEEKTKIGLIADRMVDSGGFLPDNIVNEMIKQEIINDKTSSGFIFDGFPRTSGQAKMLDEFMHKKKTPIGRVIHLDCHSWIALARVVERGKTSGRKDDTQEVFEVRWNNYIKETVPAIGYFSGRGKVVKINVDKEIDAVYLDIKNIIDGL